MIYTKGKGVLVMWTNLKLNLTLKTLREMQ